jgi:hypothetical protein
MADNPKVSYRISDKDAIFRVTEYLKKHSGEVKNFSQKQEGNKIEVSGSALGILSMKGAITLKNGVAEVSGNFPEKYKNDIVSTLTQILKQAGI